MKKSKTADGALEVVPKAKLKRMRKPIQKPHEGAEMVVRAVRAVGEAAGAIGRACEAVRPIVEKLRRKQ